jgi:hypothetical protein
MFNNNEELHLKILFYLHMGRKLDLKNPKTLNEKMQWLKLYDHRPEYKYMVDKITAKDYATKMLGSQYVVPLLGVWDKPEDIDFNSLPDKFVLKTNHSGGNTGVIVCKDKSKLNKQDAINKLNKSLKSDISVSLREWVYDGMKKQVFAEELLESSTGDIDDYKFYCFDGYADAVLVCVDRQIGEPKFYFFDENWQLKRYNKRGKEAPKDFTLPKPSNIEKMFEIARLLSKGIPHLRVDLYNVDGKIYFGETTFFTASGFDTNRLPEADLYFGDLVKLPKK